MAEVVQLGESYRWRIEELERKNRKLERALLEGIGWEHHTDLLTDSIFIQVSVAKHRLVAIGRYDLAEFVARELTLAMMGAYRDHRPDLRTPDRLPL
jgi:hypothetical protein